MVFTIVKYTLCTYGLKKKKAFGKYYNPISIIIFSKEKFVPSYTSHSVRCLHLRRFIVLVVVELEVFIV